MAQVINSTDYLTFILTQYGLNRVGEALANPNEDLNISKIKVGDANFTYYEPTEAQTELVHLIPDGEFYIIKKELLEDNLTVSFHAIFPETFQNAEIREVWIYETIDGVDYLFAVSTQQPLLKPYMDLNYLISVDYYAFLKAQNLAEVYDQIVLNPDNQLVSGEDLENLMSTILFTGDNLMDQIHDNLYGTEGVHGNFVFTTSVNLWSLGLAICIHYGASICKHQRVVICVHHGMTICKHQLVAVCIQCGNLI